MKQAIFSTLPIITNINVKFRTYPRAFLRAHLMLNQEHFNSCIVTAKWLGRLGVDVQQGLIQGGEVALMFAL